MEEKEKEIILSCLKFILNSDALIFEFEARLGINEDELNAVIDNFPNIDDSIDYSNETLAINNCLNEISHGIFFTQTEWEKWFSQSREEIKQVYQKWANSRGWNQTGIR